MEVKIISQEIIKPSCPTPHHLRIHKLSILDQLFPPRHLPTFAFYLNNNQNTRLTDIITDRSKRLKQSLSETLTRFYPLAGKIKDDDLYIDCNDQGVYYTEALVNYSLVDFLSKPDYELIRLLTPENPDSMELISGTYIILIQVNFFECGGIAIAKRMSHQIGDGHTHVTFSKAWAATARGSAELVHPNFIASSLFPQNRSLLHKCWPFIGKNEGRYVTRRFVFDTAASAALKAKASSSSFDREPTRVEAISALMGKCVATAISTARRGSQRPFLLAIPVSLRTKKFQPLPKYSIGNIMWYTIAQCMPDHPGLDLHYMADQIRHAIAKIDGNFVEELKSPCGFLKVSECLKELRELVYSDDGVDYLIITSLCNTGHYGADFGWGEPIWLFHCTSEPKNMAILRDTRSEGGGIEAVVTLSEQHMSIFERDPELLAHGRLIPSPLEPCNPAASHPRL